MHFLFCPFQEEKKMKNKFKPILVFLLVVVITLSFFACGNNNTTDTNKTDNSSTNTNTTDTSSENNDEAVQLNKFQQFEKGLSNKQIEFEIVQKMGSMVGAKEGYGYKFSDETSVELYLFDKNSDAYKEAIKNNKIYVESLGIAMDVVFNDDICIYYNGEVAYKADIEVIFEGLK
jgi:hypothetical protein